MPRRSSGSPPEKPDLGNLRFTEVTRKTRADFENLFEAPGGPKYCWCMAWRHSSREHVENDEKERMMMASIEAGTPVGILAELDGKTVGWCSVAPRQTYRKLSPQQDDAETDIWSIVASMCRERCAAAGWRLPCSTLPSTMPLPRVRAPSRPIRSTRHRRAIPSWVFATCSPLAGSTRSAWPALADM